MIDTIIFDAEGVVIDTEPIWDKAEAEFLRRRGLVYDRTQIKHLLSGRSISEGAEILRTTFGLTGDLPSLVAERIDLVRAQLERQVAFIPGFPEFFHKIQPAFKTAIATAMAEELLATVDRRLGLRRLFAGKVFSLANVGYRSKPNPDLFLYASAQLGSNPATCLVIEDAPHGVEAARRAGMKCVALATTYEAALLSRADLVVHSFSQINPASLCG